MAPTKNADNQSTHPRPKLDLSVVIVNWNTGELLHQCVESILNDSENLDVEIIVVDNASTDSSMSNIREDSQIKLILNATNNGFARANNQGFAIANGRYFLMLNPDTIILPGALGYMVHFMDDHPEAAGLGPQLLNLDRSLQPSCSHFPSLMGVLVESLGLNRLFPKNPLFARWLMTDWKHDKIRVVDQPSGACLLLRRTCLDQIGFLDERFFVYLEEVDLCYRLEKSGSAIYYLPTAQVIHYGGQSSIKNLDVRIVTRYRSLLLYFEKHFPTWYVVLVRLLIAFQMLLRITTLPVIIRRLSIRSISNSTLLRHYIHVFRFSLFFPE